MNYPSAAGGLKMMFLAQILIIAGSIVAAVGLVLTVVSLGILFIVPLLGGLLVFIGGVVNILGLFKAGADDEGYRGALLFAIIGVVVGVIIGRVPEDAGLLRALLGIVQSVLNFVVVNAVCRTTGLLLHSLGNEALSQRGDTVSKLYLACTAITVVCTLVGSIPILSILAGLAGFVGAVISLVGYVLYLGFLNSSSQVL